MSVAFSFRLSVYVVYVFTVSKSLVAYRILITVVPFVGYFPYCDMYDTIR